MKEIIEKYEKLLSYVATLERTIEALYDKLKYCEGERDE
jgi:hypothetical protein